MAELPCGVVVSFRVADRLGAWRSGCARRTHSPSLQRTAQTRPLLSAPLKFRSVPAPHCADQRALRPVTRSTEAGAMGESDALFRNCSPPDAADSRRTRA